MKILFDTDIGSDIDDALALLLLLRIPDVDLIGVTTVYGCTDIRAKVWPRKSRYSSILLVRTFNR